MTECIVITICVTIVLVVLICVIGKSCRLNKRLKHEEEVENKKWDQKMLMEDKRAEILDKKAWFEEELKKIRVELEDIKKKV